jgi:hypothetical protein
MDLALQAQMTFAALGFSVAALCFSLLAAFPGLKDVLAVIRDGVLWFALFVLLGAGAFVAWQQVERQQSPSITTANTIDYFRPVTAGPPPQERGKGR